MEARSSLNRRGIVLKSELGDGGSTPLRTGQCWKIGNDVIEILAFNGENLEVMRWSLKSPSDGLGSGSILFVSPKDDYWGYPTGMGGRQQMSRVDLKLKSQGLVELGTDWFDNHDGL